MLSYEDEIVVDAGADHLDNRTFCRWCVHCTAALQAIGLIDM